jgi:hypothetical protein
MCRISAIDEDWADKGCHVHVGRVEVALRPDHLGGIVCRKVFSTTADWKIDAASKVVMEALEDSKWRHKLSNRLKGAMMYLRELEGEKQAMARGRLRELRMLLVALERWEQG